MVLQHFTWQQFLVTAAILTAIWYAGVILIFYRQKIQDLLNGKLRQHNQPEPLKHAWAEDFEGEPAEESDDLIGKSALPEGMSKVSMSMFGFAPDIDETPIETETNSEREREKDFKNDITDQDREREQSIVPDVLEELKSIYHILETEQGTKADFISLFALVSSKYRGVRGTANQEAINDHIRENLPFDITDEELGGLWP
ncbi:hypothetical protein SAMN05421821_10278 [Mucilaginibacter lappiensis]|uniref:Uncharacterized protein n=1 Tax=Mucilaginibacter lappiensis TaxID=354630 RepID=A0ABR6PFZ8_9SPHI|nr:hypothetical protein [Mucilaginibacter lappiensis]MBB6108687.1 hypothetical protein [Mucilaginibacter lappiensis]SIQ27764.1 hypothetical protein SAMN05421821_10278 [Mucilaginibacter lappiensis]